MLLICQDRPFLRILNADGSYTQFEGGKLVIEDDDPNYQRVLDICTADPGIVIMATGQECPHCGEVYAGKTAKANLSTHLKAVHFDKWVADKEAESAKEVQAIVKDRAPVYCDACNPPGQFQTKDELVEHVKLLHESAPVLTESGELSGEDRRPGEVDVTVPAAVPSGG